MPAKLNNTSSLSLLLWIYALLSGSPLSGQPGSIPPVRPGSPALTLAEQQAPRGATLIRDQVIRTSAFIPPDTVLIAYYNRTITEHYRDGDYTDLNRYNVLLGYMYLPQGQNACQKIFIDTIPNEAGDPQIISVFFVRPRGYSRPCLAVLCRYEERHYDYGGRFYATYIYDYSRSAQHFIFLKTLSHRFSGCD